MICCGVYCFIYFYFNVIYKFFDIVFFSFFKVYSLIYFYFLFLNSEKGKLVNEEWNVGNIVLDWFKFWIILSDGFMGFICG